MPVANDYVIFSKSEDWFWSNDQGWVTDVESATVFTSAERDGGVSMPTAGGVSDAEFLPLIRELKVKDLAIGDRVDLRACKALEGKTIIECEYFEVSHLEWETDSCILLFSDAQAMAVGLAPEAVFPVKPMSRRDGEVIGLDEGSRVRLWHAKEGRAYTSRLTLDEYGIHNLTENEVLRVGVDESVWLDSLDLEVLRVGVDEDAEEVGQGR